MTIAASADTPNCLELPAASPDDILRILKELSTTRGGAWVFIVPPFARPDDKIKFRRFASPARVPDRFIDLSRFFAEDAVIGWKGRIVPFTPAAVVRERNRGVSDS